jgi:hypothetical protein
MSSCIRRKARGPTSFHCVFPTSRYTGRGMAPNSGFPLAFTDADYRSLALVSRLMTESLGIPRNIPLLPTRTGAPMRTTWRPCAAWCWRRARRHDDHDVSAGPAQSSPRTPRRSTRGTRPADTRSTGFGPTERRNQRRPTGPGPTFSRTRHGGDSKRCYRGFLSHVMPGPSVPAAITTARARISTGIDSPARCGTVVVSVRFSMLVFGNRIPAAVSSRRPYRQANKDTPLVEYYFDRGSRRGL